jgi:hypothetical protein
MERITTKMLLIAIALGLWASVATNLYYLPRPIRAAGTDPDVALQIGIVAGDLQDLVKGVCRNDKLC